MVEVVRFGRSGEWREVAPVVGSTYLLEPLNPQKKKHRGRRCILLRVAGDRWGRTAEVRFLDVEKGRAAVGVVALPDLVAASPEPQTPLELVVRSGLAAKLKEQRCLARVAARRRS